MYVILLIFAIIFNVFAQLILKHGMKITGEINFNAHIVAKLSSMLMNTWLWLGLIAYGISFLIYMIVLSKMEVSRSSAVMMCSVVVLVFIFSVIFLNENISPIKIVGIILSLTGCILILIIK